MRIRNFEKKILKQILLEWWAHPTLPADRVIDDTFREHRVGKQQRTPLADAAFKALKAWPWTMGMNYQAQTPDEIRQLDSFLDEILDLNWSRFIQKHEKSKPKFELSPVEHLNTLHGVNHSLLDSWPQRSRDELNALHEYLHASFEAAPFVIRTNTRKTNRKDLMEALKEFSPMESLWAPQAILFRNRFPLTEHPLFDAGHFEVQDEHSQIVSHCCPVNSKMRILDMCAGAGGKSLHLADLMEGEGEVYAYDIYPEKLLRLQERARRLGLNNIRTLPNGIPLGMDFDLVLVDAPCSSLGTLRRNPDRVIKWHSQELSQTQSEIILKGFGHLKANGIFAYATCTLRPEENALKLDSLTKEAKVTEFWKRQSLEKTLPSLWPEETRNLFLQKLRINPAFRLRGVTEEVLQWGPDAPTQVLENGHLSGTLSGDGFFFALYTKEI